MSNFYYCPECQKAVDRKWDGFEMVCAVCGYDEVEAVLDEPGK